MTYQELIATRAIRSAVAKQARDESCNGCGVPFARYGMTKAQAYVEDGKHYCGADCACEAYNRKLESDDWNALAEEY